MAQLAAHCAFRVGNVFLALPVRAVQEIIDNPRHTRVPGAHPAVTGLVNLRGHVLTSISMHHILSGNSDPAEVLSLICEFREETMSLLVDEVIGVFNWDLSHMQPMSVAPKTYRKFISGVFLQGERDYLLLDAQQLIDHLLSTS